MMKFYYDRKEKMSPRPGVKYATTYYKQTASERKRLMNRIVEVCRQVGNEMDRNKEILSWAEHTSLKGFPKTKGQPNRTALEIFQDMKGEAFGTKKNGDPKDFAEAPIERWNRLMMTLPEDIRDKYIIEMCEGERPTGTYERFF